MLDSVDTLSPSTSPAPKLCKIDSIDSIDGPVAEPASEATIMFPMWMPQATKGGNERMVVPDLL